MTAVGMPLPRKDALDKLKGASKYIDDYSFSDMLHVFTVRSNVAYGRLISINTDEAKKMPGVVGVITAKDIPGNNNVPLVMNDEPFLAEGFVRFHGEPIALVAAETYRQAQEAAEKVQVEIEPYKPILSIKESISSSAAKIYGQDNVFCKFNVEKGCAEEAIKKAEYVFEQEYETPYQEHVYLETNGVIAVPGPEESMTIYGSMQCPFYVHDAITEVLNVSRSAVRIVQTTTGGAFGGKEDFPSLIAGQAAVAAKILNRPVKLVYKRDEDIMVSSKRHPGLIKMKIGTDKNGKITAALIDYYLDGGAYSTLTPLVLWRGTVHALGPYECENVHIRSWGVATNKVPAGAYRGFGSPQTIFAAETMLDEIADKLNISPLELRLQNCLKIGSKTVTSQTIEQSCGLKETIEKAAAQSKWAEKWQRPSEKTGSIRKGIGISTIYYGVGLGSGGKAIDRSGTSIIVQKDGTACCAVGNVEMGQGAKTVLSQIAADALGVDYLSVKVLDTDTGLVPDSGPTVASRTTFMSGNSLINAATQLKPNLLKALAALFESENPDDFEIADGVGFLKSEPNGKTFTFKEIAAKLYELRLKPSAYGWFLAPDTTFDQKTGQGAAYYVYTYCTNIAEVEVDTETGVYKVSRLTSAYDVGKAVNPQQVEGQIEGGTIQGMGYGTIEEIRHSPNGQMLNNSLSTYLIPTAEDVPAIDPIIVEHGYDKGPYGAKGLGEVPLMGVAPAVVNAIYNATGKRLRKIPATPERILGLEN